MEALRGAQRLIERAEGEAAVGAHRVAALAARELHRLSESTRHFEVAAKLANEAGDAETSVRLLISLAGNHAMRGSFDQAQASLDRAAADASGYDRVLVDVQRATVYLAGDRLTDAELLFRQTLPHIEAKGDEARLVHVLGNLGSTQMQLGRFEDAMDALSQARRLYSDEHRNRPLVDVVHNLGLCSAWSGHIPEALEYFHEAKELAAQMGIVDAIGLLDEARALLPARLAQEAEAAAREALQRLQAGEVHTWAAEAHLVLAQALLASGQMAEARTTAEEATQLFTTQGRPPGAALAAKVALTARDDLASPATAQDALDLADELDDDGLSIDGADLRVAVARAALRDGDRDTARTAAASVQRRPGSAPAGLRIREEYAAAIVRYVDGDTTGAFNALESGLRSLETHRLSLGATELRVRASELGVDVAELGLRIARETRQPREVFDWAERLRANSIEYRPARPPVDHHLRDALAAVRQTAQVSSDISELAIVERRVVDALRRSHGLPTKPVRTAVDRSLPAEPGTIAFFEQDGWLHRIDVNGDVEPARSLASLTEIKAHLSHFTLAWRRWLRLREAPPPSRRAAQVAINASIHKLDDLLQLPAPTSEVTLVIPSEAIHGVPWAAIPALEGQQVRLAPSAAVAHRQRRAPGDGVVLIAGPDLEWSHEEVVRLAELSAEPTVLRGAEASCEAALAAMEGADVVHVAAHGDLRLDNPLFSALRLGDGPLTVCDIEQLTNPPRVVVLSACDAGVPRVHPGNEVMGLVAALLQAGTDTVVAPVLPIEDEASIPVMQAFHAELSRGVPPAAALRTAVDEFPLESSQGLLARSFLCFGQG